MNVSEAPRISIGNGHSESSTCIDFPEFYGTFSCTACTRGSERTPGSVFNVFMYTPRAEFFLAKCLPFRCLLMYFH